jgi:outer membrane protein assembly factor BamB
MSLRRWVAGVVVMLGMATALTTANAGAALRQTGVVLENAADQTPQLVSAASGARPRVNSLARAGPTVFAGGLFERVVQADGTALDRANLMAFDAATGLVRRAFAPRFNGQVWAVETGPDGRSVFVGGAFTAVNDRPHVGLVKLDSTTGKIDRAFQPFFAVGSIYEIDFRDGRLVVGGDAGRKLMALNPRTGADTGYIDLGITSALPGTSSGVAVNRFAVNPAGTKLVATGNFQRVSGKPRTRLFVANLRAASAKLDSWYYPGFALPCTSTNPAHIAYLQGVDFSPDGDYFVVTATGAVVRRAADKGRALCDGAARFELDDPSRPVWINYTGGDSVWSVAVTGAAVYVMGHFRWLDNPVWHAGQDGGGPAPRFGIGAIGPRTGRALAWNPRSPAAIGGKDFLVSPHGVWAGSDSATFNGEPHVGIAFMPLPRAPRP